ncbi:ribbon-helix-helix protein, CopG family [Elizabethkingia sp. HX WHF]|nr:MULTISPECIES: ribbon-helix-helix protein, CopG family [Elizabethkingia]MCT4190261.1 ribbon-helix-helix protein, CopG family [Elizabethkingia anophelis]MCT4288693.1 ribbon-helix-helix protein, CopG family [Elizabethkingia anophelis]MDV3585571.1 ribbon-helix-helix protein, CopG family [Elizabethkingia anophelis]MDV3786215.1 ribbon-helix-helix protein, CopG family [Elizabethkingia anophelis]MDX8564697.1 ribbon-helix-helix protein, CopG family [Elizabethkingia sp. HX WHF]
MAKKLLSIRVSDEVDSLLKKIAEKRQSTQANVVEEAIRDLAKKEKLK